MEEDIRSISSRIIKVLFIDELRREERVEKRMPVYYHFPREKQYWTLSQTINISRSGLCILIDRPVAIGETIEIEIGRKLMDTREVFQILGKVVDVTVDKDNRTLCHIALLEKKVTFHRINNVLWSLADINCWFLEKYTLGCQGMDVDDLEELKAAYRLVYQEYSARKLCVPSEEQMFYNAYSFVPGSRTFALKKGEDLLGTICLVADSPMGFPMESIFPEEIQKLRNEGRLIAEVGALSLNSKFIDMKKHSFKNFKKQAYLFKLYKTMLDYACATKQTTDFIIGCHPRHEFLYKYLNFETLSPAKSYQGANAAPAVLMRLNIPDASRNTALLKEGPGVYFLKDVKYNRAFNYDFRLPQHFVQDILKNSTLWSEFTPKQKTYLKGLYDLYGPGGE